MTLTNFWWLLLWMMTAAMFIAIAFPKRIEYLNNKKVVRWTPFSAFLVVLPYIIWAAFRSDSYGDTYAYRTLFGKAPEQIAQWGEYLQLAQKDKGFYVLMALIKSFISCSDVIFFLLVAIIQLGCIVYMYRKYSINYWLSIFIFVVSCEYISWVHNGMRQFLAAAIVFLAGDFLIKKRYGVMIIMILLAATIHTSALMMLPCMFIIQGKAWNKKTIIVLVISMASILMIDRFTNILDFMLSDTAYSGMITDWKETGDDGTNPIRVAIYTIPMILSVIGMKRIREVDDPMINLSVNASVCAVGIYIISMFSSGIYIGRLPIYFTLFSTGILLPWEIDEIFTERSNKLLIIIVVLFYSLFFYYQMHFTWSMI